MKTESANAPTAASRTIVRARGADQASVEVCVNLHPHSVCAERQDPALSPCREMILRVIDTEVVVDKTVVQFQVDIGVLLDQFRLTVLPIGPIVGLASAPATGVRRR